MKSYNLPESGQLILSEVAVLLNEKADTWAGVLYIPHLWKKPRGPVKVLKFNRNSGQGLSVSPSFHDSYSSLYVSNILLNIYSYLETLEDFYFF